jgi:hypothetical protein
MKSIHTVVAAGVAACILAAGSATADDSRNQLDAILTQQDGMTQISDGLYARLDEHGEAYVAVGEPAQKALALRLVELQERLGSSGDGTRQADFDALSKGIADLTQPAPKNQYVSGDCTGPGGSSQPQLYARAESSFGLNSNAYAVLTSDFGPITWTVNYATALTQNRLGVTTSSQTSTQNADTAASASATAPNSNQACMASSYASVKCPGQSSPAISAAALTYKTAGCLQ